MNRTSLKTVANCACLMALLHAEGAAAHTQSGTLGNAAGAMDFYEVTCSDDGLGPPARLVTQIKTVGTSSSPRVSLQVVKGGAAIHSTDPVNGDVGSGPALPLSRGPGNYKVMIDKDGSGIQRYSLEYHCQTSDGQHTGGDTLLNNLDTNQ